MSNHPASVREIKGDRPRVVFFGMRCAFSAPPLAAIINAGLDLRAIVLPGPPGSPRVRIRPGGNSQDVRLREAGTGSSINALAANAHVPIIELRELRDPEVEAAIRSLEPDIIAVACFPWRIPARFRAIASSGCLNLHPSLLPRWRGPEPLFWTLKLGDPDTGVTVHLMNDGFDSGPVIGQSRLSIPAGIDGLALERELATLGGELLVDSIAMVATGDYSTMAQDEASVTLAPVPDDSDLVFSTDFSASRLFNLIRGIGPLWGPLRIQIAPTGAAVTVSSVFDYDESMSLDEPLIRRDGVLLVQCNPGTLMLLEPGSARLTALTRVDPV